VTVAHAGVQTAAGVPITGEVYDQVVTEACHQLCLTKRQADARTAENQPDNRPKNDPKKK